MKDIQVNDMSESMNGYVLLKPFQIQNAGFSRWTVAEKRGRKYFLKEFLDPVYPVESTLADSLKEKIIRGCLETEKEKIRLYEAINTASAGNLVRINEYFRCDTHYYITMDYIPHESVDYRTFSFEARLLLCRSIAYALARLHEAHVVHADIKADNVLLKKNGSELIGKIIDFDNAFFEETPPHDESEINGDQIYLAPETCRLMFGEDIRLDRKIDVFAAGLLFHQYLSGSLPDFDHREFDYPHEALLDGQKLIVSAELPRGLRDLFAFMLDAEPENRPEMIDVFRYLGGTVPAEQPPHSDTIFTGGSDLQ